MLLYGLAAFLPVAVLVCVAAFSKKGIVSASIAALISLVGISVFFWKMSIPSIAAFAVKGVFVSLEIGAIVFGALLLFELFSAAKGGEAARSVFRRISSEKTVQAVMVAWAFVHFMEGVSGFGTPAMIAAPILMALGFSPLAALSMCLIGDSVPVIFGAVGLPVTYGFGSIVGAAVAEQAGILIAFINMISSLFVVSAIAFIANKDTGGDRASFVKFMPFVILASFSVSLPAFLTALFIGPELPSIVGGIIGMTLIFMIGRKMYPLTDDHKMKGCRTLMEDTKPFIPYIIAVALLAATRIPFIKEALSGIFFEVRSIFGQDIGHRFVPLYAAGVIFITSSFLYMFLACISSGKMISVVKSSLIKLRRPLVALSLILVFVQIFINSGINMSGAPSMPEAMVMPFAGLPSGWWLFIAPFVGAFGAFIAGGATISNLLMTSMQVQIASLTGTNQLAVVALQGLGAAGGNMIAIHNILAALAVVGAVNGMEKKLMKMNFSFAIIYFIILGMIGTVMGLMIG